MFCSTCSARLLDGATFCNQCGAAVTGAPRSDATTVDALQVERLGEPAPPLEVTPAPFVSAPGPLPILGTPLPTGPVFAPPALQAPTAVPVTVRYGGFWRRFWGSIVDSAWCYLIGTLIMLAFRMDVSFDPTTMNMSGSIHWGQFAIGQIVGLLYSVLFMCSPAQGTLGQLLFNLKVTDVSGRRISFLRATGRHFAQFLSSLLLFIGYLMIAFHPQKRGLHDLIAGTLVVHREREAGSVRPR